MKEIINTMQQKHKQAGERGGRAAKDGEEQGNDRGQGDGGRRRGEKEDRSRGATLEEGERSKQPGRLRQRVHQLEKEKLELTSSHNQEVRSKGLRSSGSQYGPPRCFLINSVSVFSAVQAAGRPGPAEVLCGARRSPAGGAPVSADREPERWRASL